MNVEYLCEALRPLSEPTRVTRLRTCLCFYDGEIEIFEYGTVDVDIYYCNSMRTLVAVAHALYSMIETLKLTFGLEYQKFLRSRVSDGTGEVLDDDSARIKLRPLPSLKAVSCCSKHQLYSSSVSPFHAKTGTPEAAIAAAA